MRKGEIEKRIRDIEAQLKTLPVGSVVNKNIKGKPQPYLQWSEDGHTKSQYLKRADRDEMMDKVVLRKNLSAELKTLKAELAKLPDEIEMPEYRCHVIQGENLQKMIDSIEKWQKRDGYEELWDYMKGESQGVICVLYGLRGTGKTTMMLQAIADLDKISRTHAAFIELTLGKSTEDLERDLSHLYAQGYRYVFIDEVTSICNFQNASAMLSDVYAMQGMKIVVTGAISLKLWLALSGELYGRARVIHTNGVTFREYARLYGTDDVEKVLRFGGTMRLKRRMRTNMVTRDEETPFSDHVTTTRYVDAAINMNMHYAMDAGASGCSFRRLNQLRASGELTVAAGRLLQMESCRFLRAVLKRNLSSERSSGNETTDAILNKLLGMVEDELNGMIDIFKVWGQEMSDAFVAMDLLAKLPVKGYGENVKSSRYMLCAMPGMRFNQLRTLITDMLEDGRFDEYSEREKREARVKSRRIVIGQLLRDTVLWETANALKDNRQVFRFIRDDVAVDMVVYSPTTDTCEMYTITDDTIWALRRRYNPLADIELCATVERDYGTITRRCVLLRGRPADDRDGIEYTNVEEYLKKLGLDA